MSRQFAFTLDLESAVSGVLTREYDIFRNTAPIEDLFSWLKQAGIKPSLFVVGEIFEKFPGIIRMFETYGCEFHCHSYSHDPSAADSEEEIARVKDLYTDFFKRPPIGYRAPQGRITPAGIDALEKHGFKFDSSVVPSYYPNPFKYLFKNRQVHRYKGSEIVEIPLTSISPFRLSMGISYIKLLGLATYRFLLNVFKVPEIVIFCCHLHDFFLSDEAFQRLPRFWKAVYRRNRDKGIAFLKEIIDDFQHRDYDFVFMSEIYNTYIGETVEPAPVKKI